MACGVKYRLKLRTYFRLKMAVLPSYIRKLRRGQKYQNFRQFGAELKKMGTELALFQPKALKETGRYLVTKIKNRYGVHQAGWAPTKTDHPESPLYDTGELRKAVKSKVVGNTVIVFSEKEDLALVHEFGTTHAGRNNTTVIPARPIWRPVAEKEFPRVTAALERAIHNIIN